MAAMRWFDPEDAEPMEALERLIIELSDRKEALELATQLPAPETLPAIDLEECDDHFRLIAEIPAVSPQELRVVVQTATVTLEGLWGGAAPFSSGRSHVRETRRGAFRRAVSLPAAVAGEEAHATIENGLLVVVLPKTSTPASTTKTVVPLR